MDTEKSILEERLLSNNALLTVIDESRKLVGDRWLVKVACEATFSWVPWMEEIVLGLGADLESARNGLPVVSFHVEQERNFVDEADKETLVTDLHQKVLENIGVYMESEQFAQKLFKKKLEEWLEEQKQRVEKAGVTEEDEAEPEDFSHCFREQP